MRRCACFILSLILTIQFGGVSYASSLQPAVNIDNNNEIKSANNIITESTYADDALYLKLRDLGFTEMEILDLYQKESNRYGMPFSLPSLLAKQVDQTKVFPSKVDHFSNDFQLLREKDGDVRHFSVNVNFRQVANYLGYTGTGLSVIEFIKAKGVNAFTKGLISSAGLSFVSILVAIAGQIFGALSNSMTGVVLYLKQRYAYDPYELMGKWYLVDASFQLY